MKTLTMYRPNTIQNALSDFDRYFESFIGDSILTPAVRLFNNMPAVDIRETDNAYILDMDLPGFDEKNIDVHVDGSNLTIASKREYASASEPSASTPSASMQSASEPSASVLKEEKSDGTYVLKERRINSFSRAFKLPENADPEAVSASFKNGILNLQIKKRAEAQKRSIQINAA